jgi:hypothetical protein
MTCSAWIVIVIVFAFFVSQVGCGSEHPVFPSNNSPSNGGQGPSVPGTVGAQSAVLTYHNDAQRTGQNLSETILTPANVTSSTFGKIFSFPTDGDIFAQPLYVPAINIPGKGKHNVVFVATANDSVYAFDADLTVAEPLWLRSFLDPAHGITSVPQSDVGGPITPEYGITSTPVIDPSTLTMYLLAFTKENGSYVQRLHALDITTGGDKIGPVQITASVKGTGVGNDGMGNIHFQPKIQLQRPALLLAGGVVYIGWGSFHDMGPYHGWVMGYSAATLGQVAVWNATPNGAAGSVWQGGSGLAQDSAGNLWLMTGNGTFDVNTGGSDYGDSMVKLAFTNPGLEAINYFTPFNQRRLSNDDLDLGSGGIMLLPLQNAASPPVAIGAGKGGTIYLVNRNNPGQFHPGNDSQIVQSIPHGAGTHSFDNNFCTSAYWQENVYFIGNLDVVRQYPISGGQLETPPIMGTHVYGFPGATPTVSARGNTNGIVWALERIPLGNAILHAYDASNVAQELYNSDQAGTRDHFGAIVNFVVPTVANGRVYVGGRGRLVVFGLLS